MSLDRDGAPDKHTPFDLLTASLEPPLLGEIDWGGDGIDPHRPVRAHVLAALMPNTEPYRPPLDALLRLGDPRGAGIPERRLTLGINQEHAPQLVRMARDRALMTADSETLKVWAPVHAVELLKELDTSAIVDGMLPLLDVDADWFDEPLVEIFARAGQMAVEPLRRYLHDSSRWTYGRANAGDALARLAVQHPELRNAVVPALREALADAEHNTEAGNGLLIGRLFDLEATEALPEIRQAFMLARVDEMVSGDWATVQRELGIEPDPDDPLVAESTRRGDERRERTFPSELGERFLSLLGSAPAEFEQLDPLPDEAPIDTRQRPVPRAAKAGQQDKKAKHKRKIAAASRKANQKKRK